MGGNRSGRGTTGEHGLLSTSPFRQAAFAAGAFVLVMASPAFAQDDDGGSTRTRIGLGGQAHPNFPGSDEFDITPMFDFDRAKGDEPFRFEGPDDSFGFALVRSRGIRVGPVVNFEGSRDADDVGALLPKVKFSLEPGGDNWLFSIGPRVSWSNDRYQDAWFGITPADAIASGLPAYDPGGGIHAVGVTASFETQLSPRWGIQTYAKYDRLVGDAADSPIVTVLGSRDQFSGGLGLTYTFGEGID